MQGQGLGIWGQGQGLDLQGRAWFPRLMWATVKITILKNWTWLRQTNTKLFFRILYLRRQRLKSISFLKVNKNVGHIGLFSWVRPGSINTYAATPPVIIIGYSSHHSHRCLLQFKNTRFDSISSPHSVWSHEETTLAQHTFHWCWGSKCAEDPLKEAMQDGELRPMLHSFPRVSVMTKSQGYVRFWVQNPKQELETFSRGQGQGRGLGIQGQGQVLNSWGQGHYRLTSRPSPRHRGLQLC